MANRICLIYEINCYDSRPTLKDRLRLQLRLARAVPCVTFASVWIAGATEDDYTLQGMKLIGPVLAEDAAAYLAQLRQILETAGLTVMEETVADD